MKQNKDIITRNSKELFHGYQEQYHKNGNVKVRCMCKNGLVCGYFEWHSTEYRSIKRTIFKII